MVSKMNNMLHFLAPFSIFSSALCLHPPTRRPTPHSPRLAESSPPDVGCPTLQHGSRTTAAPTAAALLRSGGPSWPGRPRRLPRCIRAPRYYRGRIPRHKHSPHESIISILFYFFLSMFLGPNKDFMLRNSGFRMLSKFTLFIMYFFGVFLSQL